MNRVLPNLFIIGGMRCGSTMIYKHLDQHPSIFLPDKKETYFLSKDLDRELLEKNVFKTAYEKNRALENTQRGFVRTWKQYEDMYLGASGQYRGDGSHYLYNKGMAKRLYELVPDCRILVSLRDPIDRLFSEFSLYLRRGDFDGTFLEFIEKEKAWAENTPGAPRFGRLQKGYYSELLQPWLETFSSQQLFIAIYEELSQDTDTGFKKIFEWLGIDSQVKLAPIHPQKSGRPNRITKWVMSPKNPIRLFKKIIPKSLRARLRSGLYSATLKKDEIDPKVFASLQEVYRDMTQELADQLNRDLSVFWPTLGDGLDG